MSLAKTLKIDVCKNRIFARLLIKKQNKMYTKQNLVKDITSMIWIASLMITGLILISKI